MRSDKQFLILTFLEMGIPAKSPEQNIISVIDTGVLCVFCQKKHLIPWRWTSYLDAELEMYLIRCKLFCLLEKRLMFVLMAQAAVIGTHILFTNTLWSRRNQSAERNRGIISMVSGLLNLRFLVRHEAAVKPCCIEGKMIFELSSRRSFSTRFHSLRLVLIHTQGEVNIHEYRAVLLDD